MALCMHAQTAKHGALRAADDDEEAGLNPRPVELL
jgi:hypothetical protein